MIQLRALKRFAEHPHINFVVGVLMFATALTEGWETLYVDLTTGAFGAHHGLMVFAVMQIIRVIPDIFGGIDFFTRNMT